MAKRRKLSDLVKEETQRPEETDLQSTEVPDSQENEVTNLQTPKLTDLQTLKVTESQATVPTEIQTAEVANDRTSEDTDSRSHKLTNSQSTQVPKYLTLIRKETRLREDQLDRLTAIARKLNRAKRGGERITENTLIRVAVDLLLDRADVLSGATEAELRDSLSLEETD
ncbi:hypothetical protein [Zarconia navalis]|uniref:hypothetical protein n=1 Tax=Zarconia navalis TaxID=2992134 RepID=UPI0021F8592A|nr:hypothetical protein [Zarconia navalis]